MHGHGFFKAWKRNQYKQILVGEAGRMHFLWGEEFLIISLSAAFQISLVGIKLDSIAFESPGEPYQAF